MDVGENSTLGDGDASQQLVQLLIVADGELKLTGEGVRLLVVTGGVASQLEDLSGEVLHDGQPERRLGRQYRTLSASCQSCRQHDQQGMVSPARAVRAPT